MAEYRVHWKEGGQIMFSWHPSWGQARDGLVETRGRLGLSDDELCEFHDIVKFDLHGSRKLVLMDFLNEHVSDGGSC